ncbi:MAG: hypothetical protein O3A14_08315 [Cyanobacteria bacterium]|nr:hypothetical protein [Cyanobacteriota bacterium]
MSIETKEYSGYWWFSENPDKTVSGTLSIDEYEGIELRTIGSLLPQHSLFQDCIDFPSQEILLGQTVDGSCITLVKPICTSQNERSSNIFADLSKSTHNTNLAVIGKRHFSSQDEIVFSSAKVSFNLLDEWLCKSGFTARPERNQQGQPTKFNLEYECPEVLEFDIDSIEAKFKASYIFQWKKSNLQWHLSHQPFLEISPAKPKRFDWYSEKFESLRRFLIVMTGFPISISKIVGYGNEVLVNSRSDFKDKEKFKIHQKIHRSFLNTDHKYSAHLLMNLTLLGVGLDKVLNSWFQKSEILDPAIILYTATLSIDLGYVEFRFLNYTQGLEALHRRVFGGKYITDDEYESISSTLIESIPKEVSRDHRRSLESRLKYGHEYSQRKRIKILLDDVWIGCLDGFIEDKASFVEKVVNTRNYLIHFDSSSVSKAVFGSDIFYMAERLKILLATHILIQLNIPRENVYRAINNFNSFSHLKCRTP